MHTDTKTCKNNFFYLWRYCPGLTQGGCVCRRWGLESGSQRHSRKWAKEGAGLAVLIPWLRLLVEAQRVGGAAQDSARGHVPVTQSCPAHSTPLSAFKIMPEPTHSTLGYVGLNIYTVALLMVRPKRWRQRACWFSPNYLTHRDSGQLFRGVSYDTWYFKRSEHLIEF